MALDAPKRTGRGSSESGSIVILTALSMVVLLGIMAFAVDASFLYTERNRMAAAADAAAKSAAIENHRRPAVSLDELRTFARREVSAHGLDPATTTVLVNRPPSYDPAGTFNGDSNYVEVLVSRPTGTFFARVLSSAWASVTPLVRAVAGTSKGPNCIVTLAPVGSSPVSMEIGNSRLSMPNCGVAVAGNLEGSNPNATIVSTGVAIGADSCTNNCSNFGTVTYDNPPPYDPIAGTIAALPTLSGCTVAPSTGTIGGNGTCYSSLTVPANTVVTLASGPTYFTGPVTLNNHSTLRGTDVTMVLANGASLNVSNNSTVRLSAPTGGLFPGVALYQPETNSAPFTTNNSFAFEVTGVVYMPAADVDIRNGLSAISDCVLFVVNSLHVVNGNGTFNNACSAYGGTPLMTLSLAE